MYIEHLGIHIDQTHKSKSHIEYVYSYLKIRKTVYKLKQLSKFLAFKILKVIDLATVKSVVECRIWYHYLWRDIQNKLRKFKFMLRRIIEICTKKPRDYPTVKLHAESGTKMNIYLFLNRDEPFIIKSIKTLT